MNSCNDKPFFRRIRSFVKREGRLTKGQQRALDELFPLFGYQSDESIFDLNEKFGRDAPKILEIGFGTGTSLAEMAKNHPENDYLGIEVHRPGVGNLLLQIEREGITNIRVMCDDAVEVLENNIEDQSLDAVYLFFADPWHKKKHHKRRIVQEKFVNLLAKKIKNGGIFHLATDWENYAEHMLEVLSMNTHFENLSPENNFVPRPEDRPVTKFEKRGHRLGHGVWDLLFKRK